MIKVGDQVYSRFSFIILDYSIEYDCFNIIFLTDTGQSEGYNIPLYIGNLGLYPLDRFYVRPSCHLPLDHPDYYQAVDLKNDIFMYKARAYEVRLDKDFNRNGIYTLHPVIKGLPVIYKTAAKRIKDDIIDVCEGLVSSTMDGRMLKGTVVRIFSRELSDQNNIRYYDRLIRSLLVAKQRDYYAVIHDPLTDIEYEIKLQYLTKQK